MGLLYGALGPGTTCWPGGGSEMLYRGGGQKMASRGGRPVIYPPTHTYGYKYFNGFDDGYLRVGTT